MLKNILLIMTALTNFTLSQWLHEPSGVTTDLNAVFCLDQQYGFIVGNSGVFIKSTDSGENWNLSTINASDDYNDVSFINPSTGIIVGNGGQILRTTDSGVTWNAVTSGVTDNLYSVSFSGMNGIIGGSSQTILYSTNGGASWSISQSGFFGGGFRGTHLLPTDTGFVAGQNSIFQPFVGKSTDGGVNWNFYNFYFNSNEGNCNDIFFIDENTGLVAGTVWNGQGAISRTTNSGTDWNTTLFANPIFAVDLPTINIGYAVGFSGTILKTTNSGISWSLQVSGTTTTLNDINFFGDEFDGVAVGEGGTILRTTNGGIPVELKSFTARLSGDKINLEWQTASEINNSGFFVERNTGDEWISLSFIEGFGTTVEQQDYFYSDDISDINYSGVIQYRLKQLDFDGSYEYSFVIEVEYNSRPADYKLQQNYPNPFNPSTTIRYSVPDEKLISIKVYDILGKEIMTLINEVKQPGIHEIELNGANLSSGIYIYKMKAGEFQESKQLLLLK